MTATKRTGMRAPARVRELVTAEQAIAAVLSFRGLSQQVRAERVVADWADLVGGRIAARSRPSGIRARVLMIEVASSAWLQELTMLRPQLLADLLARVGEPRLFDDISFRIIR